MILLGCVEPRSFVKDVEGILDMYLKTDQSLLVLDTASTQQRYILSKKKKKQILVKKVNLITQ